MSAAVGPTTRLGRAALLAAAVLGLQALVLHRAFHGGLLSGLIPWDDCLILLRSLYNLRVFQTAATPMDFVRGLGEIVVHSPVSDLPTMLGHLLTRGATWAPYALNAGPVFLAVYAVLVRAARPGVLLFAAMAVCMLLQPMTIAAMAYLKADWRGGLLMAAAIYLLHEAARRPDRSLKVWGAGLLGLAAAAKLTAFYLPVFGLVVLAAFEVLGFAASRTRGEELGPGAYLARERPTLSLCAALVVGPYLTFFLLGALGHHRIVAYIVFALGEAWSDGLTPLQRAGVYGPFGNPAWGHLHWLLLLCAAAALAVSVARRAWLYPLALLVMTLLVAMFLAPLVAAGTSNPDFGAMLLGVVLAAALVSLEALADAIPRFGGAAALALTVALTATVPFRIPLFAEAPTAAERVALAAVYGRIVDDAIAPSPGRPPRMLVFYEHLFAPFPNLSLLHFAKTGVLMDVDRVDDLGPAAAERLAGSDFVLTLTPAAREVRGLERRFATSIDPAAADRFVAAQPGLAPVATYPIPQGRLTLYRPRASTAN